MRSLFIGLILVLAALAASAAQDSGAGGKSDHLDPAYLRKVLAEPPFWAGDTMRDESVLMISRDGAPAEAPLLFEPIRIVSVRNARQDRKFVEGKDWVFRDGRLRLLPDSQAPFMTTGEIYPAAAIPKGTFPKTSGGFVRFSEGHFFHDRQLVVTYTHKPGLWRGPVPRLATAELPRTLGLLKAHKPLRIVLLGDSISVGANESGFTGAPPFLPVWGELVAAKLRMIYGSPVDFKNPSVGGKTSRWGLEVAREQAGAEKPDLVIVAFGMNDGALEPEAFTQNLRAIMAAIKKDSPHCEFILVATTLPNPEMGFWRNQEKFVEAMKDLAGPGVALADMTGVHAELMKRKRYLDMTGNGVNHPNDFLARWYYQVVSGLLVP